MELRHSSGLLDLTTPVVMGILNVTPDSFSDGGRLSSVEHAVDQALAMQAQGAAIIDIGGESTRPGSAAVDLETETRRVLPVVQQLRQKSDVIISVDTNKPQLMADAAVAGANLINDVTALSAPGAVEVCREHELAVCLMHMLGLPKTMQDKPQYDDVLEDIYDFLARKIEHCIQGGIAADQIAVDPGFGFGKTLEHNLTLLRFLDRFNDLGVPLLVGLSRKSMLEQITGQPVDQRLAGSLALAALATANGASIIRVHDIAASVDVVAVAAAVRAIN